MKETRDPIDVTFGASLRARRATLGMSLEELGRRIGVTYQQVQKYETGANRVSISAAARIAKAFGCPLAVLVAPIEDAEREPAPRMPSVANLKLAGRIAGQFDALPPHVRAPLAALVSAISDGSVAEALPVPAEALCLAH